MEHAESTAIGLPLLLSLKLTLNTDM